MIHGDARWIAGIFHNRPGHPRAFGVLRQPQTTPGRFSIRYLTTRSRRAIPPPYNTSVNRGLPPGPIAAPGKRGLEATLWPGRTDYLILRAKDDGSGVSHSTFARTNAEHEIKRPIDIGPTEPRNRHRRPRGKKPESLAPAGKLKAEDRSCCVKISTYASVPDLGRTAVGAFLRREAGTVEGIIVMRNTHAGGVRVCCRRLTLPRASRRAKGGGIHWLDAVSVDAPTSFPTPQSLALVRRAALCTNGTHRRRGQAQQLRPALAPAGGGPGQGGPGDLTVAEIARMWGRAASPGGDGSRTLQLPGAGHVASTWTAWPGRASALFYN